MYTISQFAKLCDTSTKTIRFYDNKGILPADYVSKENGYRFYDEESIKLFKQISALKKAGFTLAEIDRHLKRKDGFSTEELIDHKIAELESQIALCHKLKEQKTMEEIDILLNKIEVEQKNDNQLNVINLWYGDQKTVLPVEKDIFSECEELIRRTATPGRCAINYEADEFIKFVAGRKAVQFISMHFESENSREKITEQVTKSGYEKYDAVFVYCSCSTETADKTLIVLDFAKWFSYEEDNTGHRKAEGSFEFNEDLEGIEVKLILFENRY